MAKAKVVTKSKADLVDAIIEDAKAEKTNDNSNAVKASDIISRAQIGRIVNAVFDKIKNLTDADERVIIAKFGSFERVERKSREYKTPQGTTVLKPKQVKLVFKSSKSLTKEAE